MTKLNFTVQGWVHSVYIISTLYNIWACPNITRSERGKEEHQDGVYRENRDWLECWASTYCSLTTETCRTLQQSFLPFFFFFFFFLSSPNAYAKPRRHTARLFQSVVKFVVSNLMFHAQSTNTVTSGRIQFVIITKLLSGRVKFVVTTKLISGRIKFVVITKLLSGRINFVVPTKLFVNATEHKNWVNPWIQQLAGETKKKQETVNERVVCSITRSVPLHSHGFDLANIFLNGLPRNQQQKAVEICQQRYQGIWYYLNLYHSVSVITPQTNFVCSVEKGDSVSGRHLEQFVGEMLLSKRIWTYALCTGWQDERELFLGF